MMCMCIAIARNHVAFESAAHMQLTCMHLREEYVNNSNKTYCKFDHGNLSFLHLKRCNVLSPIT